MIQTQIQNHVSLVIDDSGSMQGQPVIEVVDAQLNRLKEDSIRLDQETRLSLYLFGDTVRCLAFDMDVMRLKTLRGHWRPDGYTALIDGVLKSIHDHERIPTPYGNHMFVTYVITDGGENHSQATASNLRGELESLGENWLMACFVPNAQGKVSAVQYGFHKDDVAVWNVSDSRGFESLGQKVGDVTSNFMQARATGQKIVRGGLLKLDSSNITKTEVKKKLTELKKSEFEIYPVRTKDPKGVPIKEFVETWTKKPYRLGSAYYQPVKKVKIQDYKHILLQDTKTGKVYEGEDIRPMLGLPDFTVEVDPGAHKNWRILPQSTSVNRKVFNDTFVLVRN